MLTADEIFLIICLASGMGAFWCAIIGTIFGIGTTGKLGLTAKILVLLMAMSGTLVILSFIILSMLKKT